MAQPTDKTPRRKRKALGKALPSVDVVGVPTQDESNLLISLWDTYAPAQYRGMMNAENKLMLQETGQKPAGRYVWDQTTMSYINTETGHIVDQDEALFAMSQFVKAYSRA